MAEEVKPLRFDAGEFKPLKEAVKKLLNQFPGLHEGEIITFEELSKDFGIAFSSDNGSLIMTEIISITDHVSQTCQYPFYVAYRTSSLHEKQKMLAQSFLDDLGQWLSKEPVTIDDIEYRLEAYPDVAGGRKITKIERYNSYGLDPSPDGVQDFVIPITVLYTNEYDEI